MSRLDSMLSHDPSTSRARHSLLLVSIRSRLEMLDALSVGVDILDLKEPHDGPLAPASESLWRTVANHVKDHVGPSTKLSAALGESDSAVRVVAHLPSAFQFAKAGPSGLAQKQQLVNLWSELRARLPETTHLVAVAYADHEVAVCLPPHEIFEIAAQFGIRHCLIDTFEKNGQSSIDHLGTAGLHRLQGIADQHNLWWSLAGAVQSNHIGPLASEGVRPDCFGVRGDVCDTSRTSRLSPDRIRVWRSTLELNQHQLKQPHLNQSQLNQSQLNQPSSTGPVQPGQVHEPLFEVPDQSAD